MFSNRQNEAFFAVVYLCVLPRKKIGRVIFKDFGNKCIPLDISTNVSG